MRILFYVWRFHDSTDGILSGFVKNCNHPSFFRVFSPSFILLSFFQCKFFFNIPGETWMDMDRSHWTWTDSGRLRGTKIDGPEHCSEFFIKLFHGGHQWECIQTFFVNNLENNSVCSPAISCHKYLVTYFNFM